MDFFLKVTNYTSIWFIFLWPAIVFHVAAGCVTPLYFLNIGQLHSLFQSSNIQITFKQ